MPCVGFPSQAFASKHPVNTVSNHRKIIINFISSANAIEENQFRRCNFLYSRCIGYTFQIITIQQNWRRKKDMKKMNKVKRLYSVFNLNCNWIEILCEDEENNEKKKELRIL